MFCSRHNFQGHAGYRNLARVSRKWGATGMGLATYAFPLEWSTYINHSYWMVLPRFPNPANKQMWLLFLNLAPLLPWTHTLNPRTRQVFFWFRLTPDILQNKDTNPWPLILNTPQKACFRGFTDLWDHIARGCLTWAPGRDEYQGELIQVCKPSLKIPKNVPAMGDVNQKNTWMGCDIALPSLAWLIHFRDEDSDRKTR